MRSLILGGGPWTSRNEQQFSTIARTDVEALARLLSAMLPRNRSAARALARPLHGGGGAMEHNGVPIDVETLERCLRENWADIQDHSSPKSTSPTASMTGAPSRPTASLLGSPLRHSVAAAGERPSSI